MDIIEVGMPHTLFGFGWIWIILGFTLTRMTKNANRPMEQIPVPSGLLACLLLIPLRGQEPCQKQAEIPHRGR